MTTLEILENTRKLLSDPKHWTKYITAVNEIDCCVDPKDYDARAWCLIGALDRFCHDSKEFYPAFRTCNIIAMDRTADQNSVADYNDLPETTHADILSLLDEAIEKVKS